MYKALVGLLLILAGLLLLLPGLCFVAFGFSFSFGGLGGVALALVWFGIGGLLTWGALAVFAQIGRQ